MTHRALLHCSEFGKGPSWNAYGHQSNHCFVERRASEFGTCCTVWASSQLYVGVVTAMCPRVGSVRHSPTMALRRQV